MTVDEYRECLEAAMDAYESARREDKPYEVEVKVDPVVYEPPGVLIVTFCTAVFICGLCIGMLIGRWRR